MLGACIFGLMSEVTRILNAIEQDPQAAEHLLPLVYNELRRLAAGLLAREKPEQTLDATALVHEAYLRLVDQTGEQSFANRRHFFAAAAEAMRRILIDNARRKHSAKHGGEFQRVSFDADRFPAPGRPDELLALDDALEHLASADPIAAELVKLRYFAGFTLRQAAEVLEIPPRTADRLWAFAKAWLFRELKRRSANSGRHGKHEQGA
jgi:RNA polymerase sigma factor (TIGR02999 family)